MDLHCDSEHCIFKGTLRFIPSFYYFTYLINTRQCIPKFMHLTEKSLPIHSWNHQTCFVDSMKLLAKSANFSVDYDDS